jgi:hypothetical protein
VSQNGGKCFGLDEIMHVVLKGGKVERNIGRKYGMKGGRKGELLTDLKYIFVKWPDDGDYCRH